MFYNINDKEIKSLLQQPDYVRYKYFIKKSVDCGYVYGLWNEEWALISDKSQNKLIPFWPFPEYAEAFIKNELKDYKIKSININDFINIFLPSLFERDIGLSIFMTDNDLGLCNNIEKFIYDLKNEIEIYE